jgi:PAS domain S-box-containing protein
MYRKHQSILDNHPDLICRFSPGFVLSFVNKSFADFFGQSYTTYSGKNLFDVSKESNRGNLQTRLARLTPDSPSVTLTTSSNDSEGQETHLRWTIIAMYDRESLLLEYQALGHDVTKERKLTLALQERNTALEVMQSEMRMVLDAMPCKVWYKDDKNTILKLNTKAAASMVMEISDVEGKNTYDLFGDSAKSYHEADLKVINSGQAILGLVERYTPNDGTPGWVQTDKIPFDHPVTGEKRILVVSTDITKLKENEALLQSINKNLDDFASLTSHDLQAPLRHIAIFAELLQTEYAGKFDENALAYLKQIRDGVGDMRGLIKSFLKFMRASPGSAKLEVLDLKPVLEHVVDRHKLDLEKFGGKIRYPKHEIMVRGEDLLLNQVVGNIIENSIKYRDPNVELEIDISARKESGQWYISIADNGLGVDNNFSANIFDLFGRSKPHSQTEGSGVGLALCKRIITLHGGTISLVQSRPKGCEIEFTLNAAAPQI